MATKIQEAAITGKIDNELLRLGIKSHCSSNLCWFTDRPVHKKSINIQYTCNHKLDEPYMTSLGYKTAEKFLQELREKKTM